MTEALDILSKFLKKIAAEQNFGEYELKVVPISSGGANYTSVLFDVTFTVGGKEIYMFAKVAAIGEQMRSQVPKLYKTESFVYTQLAEVYKRLEEDHQLPQGHRLKFSKFYGCNTEPYEETVVLENLFKSGYEAYDRFKSMSKEYAYSAAKELAKFHALSFAYAKYYPKEFNVVSEEFKYEFNMDKEHITGFFQKQIELAIISTINENLRGPLQRFFEGMPPDALFKEITLSKKPVLGHGDFRPSNLMHRIRKNGIVDIKIVDLQTIRASSPVVDLLYFLFTGSDEQFRSQHYEKLLDHYYTQLAAAMRRLHVDPETTYSRAEFEREWKQKLPLGLSLAVFLLPIITVEEANAPKVDKDLNLSDFSISNTNDLYTERLNGLVRDFYKWGILKD